MRALRKKQQDVSSYFFCSTLLEESPNLAHARMLPPITSFPLGARDVEDSHISIRARLARCVFAWDAIWGVVLSTARETST
eukprot:6491585-Amphidinium_carterae.1